MIHKVISGFPSFTQPKKPRNPKTLEPISKACTKSYRSKKAKKNLLNSAVTSTKSIKRKSNRVLAPESITIHLMSLISDPTPALSTFSSLGQLKNGSTRTCRMGWDLASMKLKGKLGTRSHKRRLSCLKDRI